MIKENNTIEHLTEELSTLTIEVSKVKDSIELWIQALE